MSTGGSELISRGLTRSGHSLLDSFVSTLLLIRRRCAGESFLNYP